MSDLSNTQGYISYISDDEDSYNELKMKIQNLVQGLCEPIPCVIILSGGGYPLEITRRVMPMVYVTWDGLIQFVIMIVAIVGLIYQICNKRKK